MAVNVVLHGEGLEPLTLGPYASVFSDDCTIYAEGMPTAVAEWCYVGAVNETCSGWEPQGQHSDDVYPFARVEAV